MFVQIMLTAKYPTLKIVSVYIYIACQLASQAGVANPMPYAAHPPLFLRLTQPDERRKKKILREEYDLFFGSRILA